MSTPFAAPPVPLTREQTIAELLDMLAFAITAREQARRAVGERVSDSAGWIVVTGHDVPVDFDISAGAAATRARPGKVHEVARFSRADAERLSARTLDGLGATSRAEHISVALDRELADLRKLLEQAQAWVHEDGRNVN